MGDTRNANSHGGPTHWMPLPSQPTLSQRNDVSEDRRTGQRGRREADDLVTISARWADSVDEKLSALADHHSKIDDLLADLAKRVDTQSYHLGLDDEGHIKRGGLADFYNLTKAGRRLLVVLISLGAGAYWCVTTGLELLKILIVKGVAGN